MAEDVKTEVQVVKARRTIAFFLKGKDHEVVHIDGKVIPANKETNTAKRVIAPADYVFATPVDGQYVRGARLDDRKITATSNAEYGAVWLTDDEFNAINASIKK